MAKLVGLSALLLTFCLMVMPIQAEAPHNEPEPEMIMVQGNSLMPIPAPSYYKTIGRITMYNAVPEQTDDTPFITASGEQVREGIIANNCLKFGTLVEIDGKEYVVKDRLNSRYGCECYDIFSWSLEEAKEFGVQEKEVTVFK